MDLRQIGCEGSDRSQVVQGRDYWWAFMNTVMNLRAPQKAGDFLSS
jgi:hypothetical protein